MSDFAPTKLTNGIGIDRGPISGLDKRTHLFTKLLIGHTNHLDVDDVRVAIQEFLDFSRRDVFSATNNEVFNAAGDVDVSVYIHHCEVASMHPTFGIDRLGGFFFFVPVALHHRISAGLEFSRFSASNRFTGFWVGNSDFDMRVHAPNRTNPLVDRVIGAGLC